VYTEEIENEFQLFEEIEQILVRGFTQDKEAKIENIEALVYPNPEFMDEEGNVLSKQDMKNRVDQIIAEVNQQLLPYQRICRTTILEKPMEMTTTKKIKRGELASGK